jgi:glycosyltransferase involved in cell wall biosynthesis
MQMRIVHVITRLLQGGAEENTILSCLHQAAQGHDVFLVYGAASKPEYFKAKYRGIKYLEVASLVHPLNPAKDFAAYNELVALLKDLRPDIVHTHTSKAGIIGRLAAKSAHVPHIVHGVHILPFVNVSMLEKFIYFTVEMLAGNVTDLFMHVSRGTKAVYERARIGQQADHVVVRSGMDLDRFTKAQIPGNWRDVLEIGSSDPMPRTMLMLASLEPRKRHLEFLDGFAKATRPGQAIRLLFAGEGPLREEIEKRIDELALRDRVKLLGHHAEPERLIALADLGVLASQREGLPRVIIQFLAGGKPVVLNKLEGIDEVVHEGINGCIVDHGSAEATAEIAVRTLLNDDLMGALTRGAVKAEVGAWSTKSMFKALDEGYALMRRAAKNVNAAAAA